MMIFIGYTKERYPDDLIQIKLFSEEKTMLDWVEEDALYRDSAKAEVDGPEVIL